MSEPVAPAHGDLSAANVFVHERGATFIDFDAARMASPGHDSAHLAAWCWVRACCREGASSDGGWAAGDAVHRGLTARMPERQPLLDETLVFHRAVELVRCARWARRSLGDGAASMILDEAMRLVTVDG